MKVSKLSALVFVPLAFCATIPVKSSESNVQKADEEVLIEGLNREAGLIALAGFTEEISSFFKYANRIADNALYTYEGKEEVQNWPNNVEELVKLMDAKFAIDKVEITALGLNPFQDLINGVGGAINNVTTSVSNLTSQIPKNITIGISGNSTSHSNGTNPLQDAFGSFVGGIGSAVGNVTSGIGSAVGNVTSGIQHAVTDIAGNVTQGINGLVNTTGDVLNHFTGGIINPGLLNDTFSFLGGSIVGILDGNLSFESVIKQGFDKLLIFTGANNPLGKFIQSVAQYLSDNPNSILANIIKFATFVNGLASTAGKIFGNVVGNVSNGAKSGIDQIIHGFISKLAISGALGLNYLQNIDAHEANALQQAFLNAAKAQGSPAAVSYTESFADVFYKIAERMYATNPTAFSVLSDPSDDNIRNFVVTAAKVVTSNKA